MTRSERLTIGEKNQRFTLSFIEFFINVFVHHCYLYIAEYVLELMQEDELFLLEEYYTITLLIQEALIILSYLYLMCQSRQSSWGLG